MPHASKGSDWPGQGLRSVQRLAYSPLIVLSPLVGSGTEDQVTGTSGTSPGYHDSSGQATEATQAPSGWAVAGLVQGGATDFKLTSDLLGLRPSESWVGCLAAKLQVEVARLRPSRVGWEVCVHQLEL